MSTPKIFRVTLEVSNLDEAAAFYATLLESPGKRHPGARHYFDCGGVILALQDPTQGGLSPTPGPKSLYFATDDVDAVHARAKKLGALAPFMVHGKPAADVIERPWGERSFYVTDKWATSCASSRTAPSTPESALLNRCYRVQGRVRTQSLVLKNGHPGDFCLPMLMVAVNPSAEKYGTA